jgi:hypothetical protein
LVDGMGAGSSAESGSIPKRLWTVLMAGVYCADWV